MDWIGDTFTSDVGWSHLQTLVDIGDRMAGSDGERRALDATRDRLTEVGARDARVEPFDITGWTRESSTLTVDGTDQHCIALPRSPAATASGPLVDVGHGLPGEFAESEVEGAVVLVRSDVPDYADRLLHRREKYALAVEYGAAAFVFANHIEGCLPPTGSVSLGEDPIGPVPALGVSAEVGARLGRRFRGEAATVTVDATIGDATSGVVRASIGPETDERLLVSSHVDAHDIAEGALDNGAGTATVVEIAATLLDRPDALDTRVELACFGAEEVGLQGSTYLASTTDRDSIRAVLNVDGVCRGRTLSVSTHHCEALTEAVEAVADRFDHPISVAPTLNPHSDHWPFVARGVPGAMIASESETTGRGFAHTHADTIEKLDVRTLREGAILLTALVERVATEGVDCRGLSRSAVGSALENEGYAEGMARTGDWPP